VALIGRLWHFNLWAWCSLGLSVLGLLLTYGLMDEGAARARVVSSVRMGTVSVVLTLLALHAVTRGLIFQAYSYTLFRGERRKEFAVCVGGLIVFSAISALAAVWPWLSDAGVN
jgi:hypothetical protein